jgi:Rrf2 family protein
MLSKKAKYGIRALLHLARKAAKSPEPVLIKDIAEEERIPKKFLEAILREFKSAGILHARPGKGGGYSLQRHPRTVNLGRVIRLIDGPLAPIPCVSQTAYAACSDCPDEQNCVIRAVMKEVRDSTARILEQTTLEDMVQNEDRLVRGILQPEFHI